MEEKTTRPQERLLLEARLANYLRSLENSSPADRGYWELQIQQVRMELAKLNGAGGAEK